MQGICDRAVHNKPWLLKYVLDQFVTRQQLKFWDNHHCIGDGYIKQYDGYQKREAQKASMKEESMPLAWHPSRYWDWCMPKDEKKETEKL